MAILDFLKISTPDQTSTFSFCAQNLFNWILRKSFLTSSPQIQELANISSFSILVVFYFGRFLFWSFSILVVFYFGHFCFGRFLFWSFSILLVVHFGRFLFGSFSFRIFILVVFHFGRYFGRFLFWSFCILVVFYFGRFLFWSFSILVHFFFGLIGIVSVLLCCAHCVGLSSAVTKSKSNPPSLVEKTTHFVWNFKIKGNLTP